MATPYCTHKPGTTDRVDVVCPDCGHWLPTHIGVEHCPVCEMADLNAQTWHEKLLSGQKSINDRRRAVGVPPPPDPDPEPDAPPTTVSIHVHGGVINEQRLRDLVRQEMLNVSMRRDGTPYPSARR